MIGKVRIRASRDGYTRGGLTFGSRAWTDVDLADLSAEAASRILNDPVLIIQVDGQALSLDERQALAVPLQALTDAERSEIRGERPEAVVLSDADRIALTVGHEVLSWLDANDDQLRAIDPDLAEGEPTEILADLVDRVTSGVGRVAELEKTVEGQQADAASAKASADGKIAELKDALAAAQSAGQSTAAAETPAAEQTGGTGDDAPPATPPRKGGKAKGA